MVHGLTGHYLKTWSTNAVCWPLHLLPQVERITGRVQILSFGYAAGQNGSEVDLDIEDAALQLINSLEDIRSRAQVRSDDGLIVSNWNILADTAPHIHRTLPRRPCS